MPPAVAAAATQQQPPTRAGVTFQAKATKDSNDIRFPSDFKTNVWANSLLDNPTATRMIDQAVRDDIKRKHGVEDLKYNEVKSVTRMDGRYTIVERFDWEGFAKEKRRGSNACVRFVYGKGGNRSPRNDVGDRRVRFG